MSTHSFVRRWTLTAVLLLWSLSVVAASNVANPAESAESAAPASSIPIPTGQTVYKIAVDTAGIYEITRAELGLTAAADPNTIQMVHDGQPVAYELVNDNADNQFDSGEVIRFYGEPFAGTPEEREFVADNIYWLWVGGTADRVTAPSVSAGTPETNHEARLTFEKDDIFSSTKIYFWDSQQVPQDSMYWAELRSNQPASTTLDFNLPYPFNTAVPTATVGFDIMIETDNIYRGEAGFTFNNHFGETLRQDYNVRRTYRLTYTVPITVLQDGANTLQLDMTPEYPGYTSQYLLNRMRIHYPAVLEAVNDKIAFISPAVTSRVSEFSTGTVADIVAWDVTDSRQPFAADVQAVGSQLGAHDITTVAPGRDLFVIGPGGARTPKSITPKTYTDLNPAGGAEWVAVTHADFMTATQTLAEHRAAFSHIKTHVVDVADVIDQYGYGFPSPHSIKDYIRQAYNNWPTPPAYVMLVGDAHYNPRNLPCGGCDEAGSRTDWAGSATMPNYMPTFYAYEDRFQGLVPSDFEYTLLTGDDLHGEIAVGRLGVNTLTEATNATNKIIRYEQNLLVPADWHRESIFVHDWDNSYDFRVESQKTIDLLPADITTPIIGQNAQPTSSQWAALRAELAAEINDGAAIVNWRGHGSVDRWSAMLRTSQIESTLNNVDLPFVSLSMDCLDGNFAYPGWDSMSESLLRMDNNRGAAAHWSSTGLGYPWEHEQLAAGFYEAIFDLGLTTIGEAITYSKNEYLTTVLHESELYAFTLQGDPAMQLFRSEVEMAATYSPDPALTNESITAVVNIHNQSFFNTEVNTTAVFTASSALNNVTLASTAPGVSVQSAGRVFTVTVPDGIPAETQIEAMTLTADTTTAGTASSRTAVRLPGYSGSQPSDLGVYSVLPPVTPADTAAIDVSGTHPTLSWSDDRANLNGYQIWRSANPMSGYASVGAVSSGTTTFSDSGHTLAAGTSYFYWVRGINGNSQLSADEKFIGVMTFALAAGD